MRRPEQDLQRAAVKYMRLQYPRVLCFHVPNEGTRDRTRGAILNGLGVVAGVPDLLIVRPQFDDGIMVCCGAAIEFKVNGGKPTAIQDAMMDQFVNALWSVSVVRSFDQFKMVVDDYLKADPIRASGNDRVQLTEGQ